jgi:peptidyl-prolyl cis-trans isomerase C
MERIPPMSKPARILLCLAALVFGSAGLAFSQDKPAPVKVAAEAKAPAKPTALSAKDQERRSQKAVTFSNGEGVTVGDLEDAMARQSPHLRKRFTDPAEMKGLVDKTVQFALLADEAERRGYGKNAEVEQTVKQNAVQSLMKTSFDEEALAKAVTDAEVKAYYTEHLNEYERPAMKRASHIVVATQEEAKKLLAEAKTADLRAFRALAREHSLDEATKLRGGDLQYFDPKGKAQPSGETVVPEAFAKAVSGLKEVGDVVAAPIKVDAGYSIVKLTGERPAVSRKLAEVSDAIRTRIARTRRQAQIDEFVAKLRTDHKPELHAERVDPIVLEVGDVKGPGVPPGFPQDRPGATREGMRMQPGTMPPGHPDMPGAAPSEPGEPEEGHEGHAH